MNETYSAQTQFEAVRAESPLWAVGLAARDLHHLIVPAEEAHTACRHESLSPDREGQQINWCSRQLEV